MHISASTLVLVPYLHKFSILKCRNAIDLVQIQYYNKNGAVWDESGEQHQHQSTNKHNIECKFLFVLVLIRSKFYGDFGWEQGHPKRKTNLI